MNNNRISDLTKQNGFTLLEVVISLIVASILGVLLVAYAGTALTRSGVPILRLKDSSSLTLVMEKMITYRAANPAETLAGFSEKVNNGNNPLNTPYFGSYEVVTNEQTTISGQDYGGSPVTVTVLQVSIREGDITLTYYFI